MPGGTGPRGVRNYLKFRALHWKGDSTKPFNPDTHLDFFTIQRDDAAVDAFVSFQNDYTIKQDLFRTWVFSYPYDRIDFFFLLNYDKILELVRNNSSFFFSAYITEPGFNDAPGMAANCSINDSPRSTFPTDLGTDGQRLKQNDSTSSGNALNYIAKLYFLTSNPQFKELFDALKQQKITAKEALAAANILAKSR